MKIFISYRRDDSSDFTGRLSDRLLAHFGPGSIFVDVDAIPIGTDFVTFLGQAVRQCDVLLVVIGPNWLDAGSGAGHRRLDSPHDFVRVEIEAAIARGIPVVPVLVGAAQVPRAEDLPDSLKELAFRNAAAVRSGPDFHHDLDRLIRGLQSLVEKVDLVEKVRQQPAARTESVLELDPRELQSNKVFVSHSSLDRQWVENEIISLLDKNGFPFWYAKVAILSSAEWQREILRGMESSDWFLLVVSPRAADSDWVKSELFWAFHHRPTRIIPAIMEHCDLWQFDIRLPRIQHVDFAADVRQAGRLLVQSLRSNSVVGSGKR